MKLLFEVFANSNDSFLIERMRAAKHSNHAFHIASAVNGLYGSKRR